MVSRDSGTTGSGVAKGVETLHEIEAHVESLMRRRVSRNLNEIHAEARRTVGQRMADGITKAAGSWRFIISFLVVLAIWMAVNVIAGVRHWDPYPFILLNLLLSCVAAIQAPIILMSQNREESRDRIRAEADYEINLKAEILLEHLTQAVEALKAILAQERSEEPGRRRE